MSRRVLLGMLAAAVVAAPAAAQAQGRGLALAEVLETAFRSGAAGPQLARQAEERARGAVQSAQSAFDWTLTSGAGKRLVSQAGVLNGFLTDHSDERWPFIAQVYGDRLLESGLRLRTGITMVRDAGEDARRLLYPLANRPQFIVDVPLNASLGEPVEGLRLEAARRDLASFERGTQAAHGAYLHQVAVGYWKALALQQRRDAERAGMEVIDEVAMRVARLAEKGEAAPAEADQWRARAGLRRLAFERTQRDFAAARLELAALLKAESQAAWDNAEFAGPFPDEAAPPAASAQDLEKLARAALDRRPDVQRQLERVRAAQLRTRAAERETDSRVALVAGFDRLMLEYSTTLGDNRSSGLRRQFDAERESAETTLQELERNLRLDLRQGMARLAAARGAVRTLRPVVAQLATALEGTRRQVAAGLAPAGALAGASDSLLESRRELIEAQLQEAQAIADLRHQTAALAEAGQTPQMLAGLLRSAPAPAR